MCTFRDERAVIVCDAAIAAVRDELADRVSGEVNYTVCHGEGTLVEVGDGVEPAIFAEAVRKGMGRV